MVLTLLFSNVAGFMHVGFMHVGHVHSSQRCCAGKTCGASSNRECCMPRGAEAYRPANPTPAPERPTCNHRHHRCCGAVASSESTDAKDLTSESSWKTFDRAKYEMAQALTPAASTDQTTSPGRPMSPGSPVQGQHDPESCSVCQSFYTARQAIVATLGVTVKEIDFVEFVVNRPDSISSGRSLHSSISVRGPPRV